MKRTEDLSRIPIDFGISLLTVAIICFVSLTLFVRCDCDCTSKTGKAVRGEHELMSVNASATDVVFCWKHDSTQQVINSTLPRNKIRIVYDGNNKKRPTIKFRWKQTGETDMATIMKECIVYMEIHCTADQYPYDPAKQVSLVYEENGSIQGAVVDTGTSVPIVTTTNKWDEWSTSERYNFLTGTMYMTDDDALEMAKLSFTEIDSDMQNKIQSNL